MSGGWEDRRKKKGRGRGGKGWRIEGRNRTLKCKFTPSSELNSADFPNFEKCYEVSEGLRVYSARLCVDHDVDRSQMVLSTPASALQGSFKISRVKMSISIKMSPRSSHVIQFTAKKNHI